MRGGNRSHQPNASSPPTRCTRFGTRTQGLIRYLGVLLSVLLPLAFAPLQAAQSPDLWRPFQRQIFSNVGMANGLPSSITTALAQDHGGVLWIGTMGGLVRYDGYRVQTFELATPRANGLPDTYVRGLLPLPDGDLLIGTNAGGLVRFHQATLAFHPYPKGANGARSSKIYALAPDGERGVWIATDGGLEYLDLAGDRVSAVATGNEAVPRNFSVDQDRAGNVWLGNENGLFERRAGSTGFARISTGDAAIDAVLHDQIWAIDEDAEGRLWVGSVQRGAVYRDVDGQWHAVPGLSDGSGPAREPTVRAFLEVAPDHMWIATDGEGIRTYVPGAAFSVNLRHDVSVPSSLPGDSVRALLLDASGNAWAATDLGAARTNARPLPVFTVLPAADATHALADPNVRSVLVDSRQRIWLGMATGHVDVIDPATGAIRHLRLQGAQLRRDVQSLAEAPDGSIWVGSQGVARVDPDTFAVQGELLPALANSPVLAMARVDQVMLLGTYNGAYRVDPRTGTLTNYRRERTAPGSLASDSVHQIEAIGSTVWYGTSNGISVARDARQTGNFSNLRMRPGDTTSLPVNLVSSIAADPRGRVWVGTMGGLAMLPEGTSPPWRFHTLGAADGFVSDKISAVQPDDRGNIWASTSNGLAVVDAHTLRVRNLGARDGQYITSFIHSSARTGDGTLLFAGQGGLTVVQPWVRPLAGATAALRITSMRIDGQRVPFGTLPGSGKTLALDAHQRNVAFNFALLDFQPAQETTYRYRMAGFDHDWTEVSQGSSPAASYTNLPHGQYTLELRAEPRGLRAQPVDYRLTITVAPLWYETAWARLLGVLLLFLLVGVLVHLRTVYLRQRAARLQAQIDEHTRELRAANERLDLLASTDELTGIFTRRKFLESAEAVRLRDEPACMLLLDLDRFKRVNDEHGHLAGDAVLRSTAGVIAGELRDGDLVGRYGGEEVVICLPGTHAGQAMAIAERIRQALHEARIWHDGLAIGITVSIGVAERRTGETMTAWLARADAALYVSKHDGRDRCTLAARTDADAGAALNS